MKLLCALAGFILAVAGCGPRPAAPNSILIAGKAVPTNGTFVLRLPPAVAANLGRRELPVTWSFRPPEQSTSLANLEHTVKLRRRLGLEDAARDGLGVSLARVVAKLGAGAGPQQFTDELVTQFSEPDFGDGVVQLQGRGVYGRLFVTFTNVTGEPLTLSASHYTLELGPGTTVIVTPPAR